MKINRQQLKKYFGIILIISGKLIWFGAVATIPLLSLALKTKALLSVGFFIVGQIMFWIGVFLLGKELYQKYKSKIKFLNWFKCTKRVKTEQSQPQ